MSGTTNKQIARDTDRVARLADVIERLRGGETLADVAAVYDVTLQTVRQWRMQAYEAAQRELNMSVESYRLAQVARREELIEAYWGKAIKGDMDAARLVKDLFKELESLLGMNIPVEREAGAQTVYVLNLPGAVQVNAALPVGEVIDGGVEQVVDGRA